jgi:hypothetical protein
MEVLNIKAFSVIAVIQSILIIILSIISLSDIVDSQIVFPVMYTFLGLSQFFLGLIMYKGNKKIAGVLLFAISAFIFVILLKKIIM